MDPSSTADDFYRLAEEQFDFDVSLSPDSSREEDDGEDEVFVGPVTCVGVEHLAMDGVSSGPSSVAEEQMWSPCSGEDFDRLVCSEAQKLSTRFKDHQPHSGQTDGTVPAERERHMAVDFVQDEAAKLDMFSKPCNRVLSPIKRETFCVQDSPVKLLPPAIQKRLLKGSGSSSSGSSVGSGVGVNSTRARLNTSSPASGSSKTRTQPKMGLRSKAGLATRLGLLPSKPLVPATSSAASLKTAKTRAVPAENASRMAPSSKVGLRSKAPPLQVRGVVDVHRRHASSSSLSSFNSSMSISPTGKAKLNASLNTSTSGPSSRAPTNMSRLASTSTTALAKTRRCTPVGRPADPPPPPPTAAAAVRGARRSFSVQSRKTSDTTDPTKVARSAPVKRAVPSTPTAFQQSPSKRAAVSSVGPLQQLGPRDRPMAFIAPNPSTRLRERLKRSESVVHTPDSLKIRIPMRLRSAGSLDSLLQEKVVPNSHLFHSTPSVSSIRRPSALPNPVNRSVISGIPAMTPKRLSGSFPADAFISTRRMSITRVELAASEEEMVVSPKIQPFSLEDADPAALQTQMQNEALTCVKVQSPEVAQEVVENMLPQKEVLENPEESVTPRQEVEESMASQKEVLEHPEENQEPEPSGKENQEPEPSGKENQEPEPSGKENQEPEPSGKENQEPEPSKENQEPEPSGKENQEPEPSGKENQEPEPSKENQEPETSGKENQEPETSGKENQEPEPSGKENQEPETSGKENQEPETSGKENQEPETSGKENQEPEPSGKENQEPETSGKENQEPETSGKENQEPETSGKENQEPEPSGKENHEPSGKENQEPETSGNLIELHSVEDVLSEDHGTKPEEILLLDVPVSLFKPEDKPLIDLSNTPDLIRTVSHKDGEIQLIDLTSPLMKWSPDKKTKVDEAPLINFSF